MTRPVVHLSDDLRARIVEHCLSERPNEGCGLLAIDGDRVVGVYPTSNLDASPVSYTVPPEEHFAALTDAEARGWSLGGVFHSHPGGDARPSMTDVQRALDPGWVYLVVGLEREPVVRGWHIAGGSLLETPLEA